MLDVIMHAFSGDLSECRGECIGCGCSTRFFARWTRRSPLSLSAAPRTRVSLVAAATPPMPAQAPLLPTGAPMAMTSVDDAPVRVARSPNSPEASAGTPVPVVAVDPIPVLCASTPSPPGALVGASVSMAPVVAAAVAEADAAASPASTAGGAVAPVSVPRGAGALTSPVAAVAVDSVRVSAGPAPVRGAHTLTRPVAPVPAVVAPVVAAAPPAMAAAPVMVAPTAALASAGSRASPTAAPTTAASSTVAPTSLAITEVAAAAAPVASFTRRQKGLSLVFRSISRVGPAVNDTDVAVPVLMVIWFVSHMTFLAGSLPGGTEKALHLELSDLFKESPMDGWLWLCRAYGLCDRGLFLLARVMFDHQIGGQPPSIPDWLLERLNPAKGHQWLSRRLIMRLFLDLWVSDGLPGCLSVAELAFVRSILGTEEGRVAARDARCTIVEGLTPSGEYTRMARLEFDWGFPWMTDGPPAALVSELTPGFLKVPHGALTTIKTWPVSAENVLAKKLAGRKRGPSVRSSGAAAPSRKAPARGGAARSVSARQKSTRPGSAAVDAATGFVPALADVPGCSTATIEPCAAWPRGAWAAQIPLALYLDRSLAGWVQLKIRLKPQPPPPRHTPTLPGSVASKGAVAPSRHGRYLYHLTVTQMNTVDTPETLALASKIRAAPGLSSSCQSSTFLAGVCSVAADVVHKRARVSQDREPVVVGGATTADVRWSTAAAAVGGTSAASAVGGTAAAAAVGGTTAAATVGGTTAAATVGGTTAAVGGTSAASAVCGTSAAAAVGGTTAAATVGGTTAAATVGGTTAAAAAVCGTMAAAAASGTTAAAAVGVAAAVRADTAAVDVHMTVQYALPPPVEKYSFCHSFFSDMRLPRIPEHKRDAGRLCVIAGVEEDLSDDDDKHLA